MGIRVARGVFTSPASPNSAFDVTGVNDGSDFTGKILFLYTTMQTANGVAGAHMTCCRGIAMSSSDRIAVSWSSRDNAANMVINAGQDTSKCLVGYDPVDDSQDLVADFVSWSSGSFRLNVSVATGITGVKVEWVVFGGDIEGKLLACAARTTNGSQDYTSSGFGTPTGCMVLHGLKSTTASVVHGRATSNVSFGYCGGDLSQGYVANASEDTPTQSDTRRSEKSDKCFCMLSITGDTIVQEGDVTALITDGITVNWSTTDGTADYHHVLLLKGVKVACETAAARSGTGDQDITGFGFNPKIEFFENIQTTSAGVTTAAQMGFGAWLSSSSRFHIWTSDQDAQGNAVSDRELAEDRCISIRNSAGTLVSQADFVSQISDGCRINWSLNGTTGTRMLVVGFGDAGVQRDLAANLTATADLAAAAKADRNMAANLTATADLAAAAKADRPLQAALTATADLAAALKADRTLSAALTATADLAALLAADRPLAANLVATADLAAVLTVRGAIMLAANLTATADILANIQADRNLAANLVATADLLADADADRPLAASLSSTADLAAFLRADRPLAASLVSTADLAAALQADRLLAAALTATADLAAFLRSERGLAAALTATADLAAMARADRRLAAFLQATADLQAEVSVLGTVTLAANLVATADLQADLEADRRLAAVLQADANLAADLEADRGLAASLTATADLLARLEATRPLAAALTATADLQATIARVRDVVLQAALLATADIAARLEALRPLAASLQADANLAARLEAHRDLQAALVATADLLAACNADRALQAFLLATADFTATASLLEIFVAGAPTAHILPSRRNLVLETERKMVLVTTRRGILVEE